MFDRSFDRRQILTGLVCRHGGDDEPFPRRGGGGCNET